MVMGAAAYLAMVQGCWIWVKGEVEGMRVRVRREV